MEQEPGGSQLEHALTAKVIHEISRNKYQIDISKLDEKSVIGLRGLIRHLVDQAEFYKKGFKRHR